MGPNLYAYVGNGPISYMARSGVVARAGSVIMMTTRTRALTGLIVLLALLQGTSLLAQTRKPKPNGSYQSCEQASTAAQNLLEQEIESGSMADIAKALHMVQDAYSPAHAGFQRWDGGTTIFIPVSETAEGLSIEHVPSLGHIVRDELPGTQAVHDATVSSQQLLKDLRERSSALNNPASYFPPNPCGP